MAGKAMQFCKNIARRVGVILAMVTIATSAQASGTASDGEVLKQACSGARQALIGGAPADERVQSEAALDGMLSELLVASRAEVVEGRSHAAAAASSTPELSAYALCLADHRLAQLDNGAPPRGANGRGPSAFASGGPPGDSGSPASNAPAASRRADCDLDLGDESTGVLSTESASLRNKCSVPVGYAYCITSANGGGSFSCAEQKFGSGWISAGGTDGISLALASQPAEVHWGFCLAKPGDDHPIASSPRWDGTHVQVTCH